MTEIPGVQEKKFTRPDKSAADDNAFFLLVVEDKSDVVIGSITMDAKEDYFSAHYHPEDEFTEEELGTHVEMYMAYWAVTSRRRRGR